MPLNLITDPWIPVLTRSARRVIRPDQIAEPDVLFPDWPRADLNIACLELLIGLVYLGARVAEVEDWREARADAASLREALAPFAPAFELDGDGPRFMQDLELFETRNIAADVASPDMLFIDSAGAQTAKNNADLMVGRNRYPKLDSAIAAMALYTLQAHAPSGGAGNRTSMRGGGPMVTLVAPKEEGLWPLIWANVPLGRSRKAEALPWMRPTVTSEAERMVHPTDDSGVEAFFGMPRRLRLVFDQDAVIGVIQKPYGTNYSGWEHPLTPHYRAGGKPDGIVLPLHPRAGHFGYRNWLGIVAEAVEPDISRQARMVRARRERGIRGGSIIVAGWAMDNMKPRDFVLSRQPMVAGEAVPRIHAMVAAAEVYGAALRMALKPVVAEGTALEALREEFFIRTQGPFEARLAAPAEAAPSDWLADMRHAALDIFDAAALPGLEAMETDRVKTILSARGMLLGAFKGQGKLGNKAYGELGLPVEKKEKTA